MRITYSNEATVSAEQPASAPIYTPWQITAYALRLGTLKAQLASNLGYVQCRILGAAILGMLVHPFLHP